MKIRNVGATFTPIAFLVYRLSSIQNVVIVNYRNSEAGLSIIF